MYIYIYIFILSYSILYINIYEISHTIVVIYTSYTNSSLNTASIFSQGY